MNNKEYNQDKDLYEYAISWTTNFYKINEDLFKEAALDKEDLQQEACTSTLHLLRKIRSNSFYARNRITNSKRLITIDKKDDVKKLLVLNIRWRLLNILNNQNLPYIIVEKFAKENNKIVIKEKKVLLSKSPLEEVDENILKTEQLPNCFKFDDIKKYCSEREYKILYEKFINHLTFKEIGKKIGISPQWIYDLYIESLKKLKKTFNKQKNSKILPDK